MSCLWKYNWRLGSSANHWFEFWNMYDICILRLCSRLSISGLSLHISEVMGVSGGQNYAQWINRACHPLVTLVARIMQFGSIGNVTLVAITETTPYSDITLTLKQLGPLFQNVIWFSNGFHHEFDSLLWNWSKITNSLSTLWILMAWCKHFPLLAFSA